MYFNNNKSCDNHHSNRLACIAAFTFCYTASGLASSTTIHKHAPLLNQVRLCERSDVSEEKAALCPEIPYPLSGSSGQSSYFFDEDYPVFSLTGLETFYYFLLSNKYITMAAAAAGVAAGVVAIPKDNKKQSDNPIPLDSVSEPDDSGSDNPEGDDADSGSDSGGDSGSGSDGGGDSGSGSDGGGDTGSGSDGGGDSGSGSDGGGDAGSGSDGGGDSGSGSDGGGNSGGNTVRNLSENASDYQTAEYQQNGTAYDMIGLADALANTASLANTDSNVGHAGEGVTIAIIDSGIDPNHISLNDNIIDTCTSEACLEHYAAYDSGSHGSHVAGIAAAEKDGTGTHGIAYSATIKPGCANFNPSCQPQKLPNTGELMKWAVTDSGNNDGASVMTMSYGLGVPDDQGNQIRMVVLSDEIQGANPTQEELQRIKGTEFLMIGREGSQSYQEGIDALKEGLIVVVSAGNHNNSSDAVRQKAQESGIHAIAPTVYSNDFLYFSKQWITVVNVNDTEALASTSHACGDASDYCIAAPGMGIRSTIPNNQHEDKSGTSMAAPIVSGGVALIKAAFPGLTLPQEADVFSLCSEGSPNYNAAQCVSKAVVNRLFKTARSLGDTALFGHGLIDLKAATQPVGEVQVQSINGQTFSLKSSQLSTSKVMGSPTASALATTNFIAIDSYDQAGFIQQGLTLIDVPSEKTTHVNTQEYLTRSLAFDTQTMTVNGGQLTLAHRFRKNTQTLQTDNSHYRLNFALNQGSRIELTTSFNPAYDFTGQDAEALGLEKLTVSSAFHSPFMAFNDRAKGIKYSVALGSGYRLESGFFESDSVHTQASRREALDTQSFIVQMNTPEYNLVPNQSFSASLQIGSLKEADSLLGTSGSGGWNFSGGSETLMTGVSIDYRMNTNMHLLVSYFQANTRSSDGQGIISEHSALSSSSYSMGLVGDYSDTLQYGLFVSQPLRLFAGSTTVQLPTRYSGRRLVYSDIDIDLTPEGRHLEYEFSLNWEPGYVDYLRFNLLRVEDYGNIPGNDDMLLLFSVGVEL